MVQRDLNFAIVDEVDSILIDEARTPLIISGMGDESSDLYERADRFVRRLKAVSSRKPMTSRISTRSRKMPTISSMKKPKQLS